LLSEFHPITTLHRSNITNEFSSHANRSTINTDDVLLLARRNEGLGQVLETFIHNAREEREKDDVRGGPAKGRVKATAKDKGKAPVKGSVKKRT